MGSMLPRVIAFATPRRSELAAAVAPGRAGALGVLDLVGSDPGKVGDILDETARWASESFGVRIGTADLDLDLGCFPQSIGALVIVGEAGTGWVALVERWQRPGRLILAE